MSVFLNGAELASVLGVDQTPAVDKIVELTNNLISDEWVNPTQPAPSWVVNIAWAVAMRAGSNPKGLTSQTRHWDDITRTERWGDGAYTGVTLTDEEKARLNTGTPTSGTPRSAARSIRLRIPDWNPSPKTTPWTY